MAKPTGIELGENERRRSQAARQPALTIELPGWHWRYVEVRFRDRTDAANELVFENEWLLHPQERELRLRGNCFVIENAERRERVGSSSARTATRATA